MQARCPGKSCRKGIVLIFKDGKDIFFNNDLYAYFANKLPLQAFKNNNYQSLIFLECSKILHNFQRGF